MARPKKIGLDYFPMDVVFNEQVQAIESIYGNDGLVWLIKFWQAAYKTEFGEVDLSGLFGDISAKNSRTTPEQQNLIIRDCITLGLLVRISDNRYSSNGVQKRMSQVSCDRGKALNRRKNELFGEQSPNNPQTTGESKVKESKVIPLSDECFQSFWNQYPKKEGKGSAAKSWKKITDPAETLKKIEAALLWQKKTEKWTKERGQFIPMPVTYLNQTRWLDEVCEEKQNFNILESLIDERRIF